jgi:hypothetical protein
VRESEEAKLRRKRNAELKKSGVGLQKRKRGREEGEEGSHLVAEMSEGSLLEESFATEGDEQSIELE